MWLHSCGWPPLALLGAKLDGTLKEAGRARGSSFRDDHSLARRPMPCGGGQSHHAGDCQDMVPRLPHCLRPENPVNSLLFVAPPISGLLRKGVCTTVDFCQFGTRWRKITRLVHWNCAMLSEIRSLCQGAQGMCSATHKHHVMLRGNHPVSHRLWTKIAEPYPTALCRDVSKLLTQSTESVALHRRASRA